jgi:hypothetical protein
MILSGELRHQTSLVKVSLSGVESDRFSEGDVPVSEKTPVALAVDVLGFLLCD